MDAVMRNVTNPPESVHSLRSINTNNMDELSKETEEALLYDVGDGAEEDVLSDYSMCLRFSDDDDIQTTDVLSPILENEADKQKTNEIEMVSGKEDDKKQADLTLEKDVTKNIASPFQKKNKDHSSGNVSMSEKATFDNKNCVKRNENWLLKLPRPLLNYAPNWGFSEGLGGKCFHNVGHFSHNRYRPLMLRGHFRHSSYEYNVRLHNRYGTHEHIRGNGMYNSHNRQIYANRQSKRGCRSFNMQKQNSSPVPKRNFSPNLDVNVSTKLNVKNDISNVTNNDVIIIEEDYLLDDRFCTKNDKDDATNKILNKNVEAIKKTSGNGETSAVTEANDYTVNLHRNMEGNVIHVSITAKCKGTVTETSDSNGSFNENLVNSAVIMHDDKQTHKSCTKSTNNVDANSSSLSTYNNVGGTDSNVYLGKNVNIESSKEKVSNKFEGDNMNNQTETDVYKSNLNKTEGELSKTMHVVEDQEPRINTKSVKMIGEVKLSEDKPEELILDTSENNTVGQKKLVINGNVTTSEIGEAVGHENGEAEVPQCVQSSEQHEEALSKGSSSLSNNLTNNKSNTIIETAVNDTSSKSVTDTGESNTTAYTRIKELNVPEDQLTEKTVPGASNGHTTKNNEQFVQDENQLRSSLNNIMQNNKSDLTLNENNLASVRSQLGFPTDINDNTANKGVNVDNSPVIKKKCRGRTKKMVAAAQEIATEENKQVKEGRKQRRRTAKNAEVLIRSKCLRRHSAIESNGGAEKCLPVNNTTDQKSSLLPSSSIKRSKSDISSNAINGEIKKVKIDSNVTSSDKTTEEQNLENITNLTFIQKFFRRDIDKKLSKLKQEELEELLIQKIVETITMRDEIGKLREQARISERNQEITRTRCQQLAKQVKDFEMVLSRNAADRRANNDKPTPPIKFNRSVGLQVNFVAEHGMQNLRQLQQNSNMRTLHIPNTSLIVNSSNNDVASPSNPRRGVKVRSPRRNETGQIPVVSQNHSQPSNIMPPVTPAALVVAKPIETQHPLTVANHNNVQKMISNQQTQQQTQQHQPQVTISLNGKFGTQVNHQGPSTTHMAKSHTNDLIDLTDEEEKGKGNGMSGIASSTAEQQVNVVHKKAQPCYQRVIQTIPGSVAITTQPPSIRVVQPASQPTPTALVNNMNAPRLAYVMQSGIGPTRQLLITPTSSSIRPITSCTTSFSTLAYKAGISTMANGSVRVLTTPAIQHVQLNKHPAPLPDIQNYEMTPLWKLPPPAPSLKISKVVNGIILSWNMTLSDKYADIASYQLYAYQEIPGIPPDTSLWKKVGDVRALPLPMACTLTQFSEGNNYYFAVRAVDTHSRKGQYSVPGNISL